MYAARAVPLLLQTPCDTTTRNDMDCPQAWAGSKSSVQSDSLLPECCAGSSQNRDQEKSSQRFAQPAPCSEPSSEASHFQQTQAWKSTHHLPESCRPTATATHPRSE